MRQEIISEKREVQATRNKLTSQGCEQLTHAWNHARAKNEIGQLTAVRPGDEEIRKEQLCCELLTIWGNVEVIY